MDHVGRDIDFNNLHPSLIKNGFETYTIDEKLIKKNLNGHQNNIAIGTKDGLVDIIIESNYPRDKFIDLSSTFKNMDINAQESIREMFNSVDEDIRKLGIQIILNEY